MEFYDIDKLIRDENQDNLYNLFSRTFTYKNLVSNKVTNVSEEQMMRLDLICQNVYANDSYVDILCSVNNIDNPLNIMEGDRIFCPDSELITSYRLDEVGISNTPMEINKADKSSFNDPNRKKYVTENFNITPTSTVEPQDPVKFTDDGIIISK